MHRLLLLLLMLSLSSSPMAATQLASRQLFRLSNPQLPGEGSDYSSYLYDPARDAFGMPPHDKADRVGK